METTKVFNLEEEKAKWYGFGSGAGYYGLEVIAYHDEDSKLDEYIEEMNLDMETFYDDLPIREKLDILYTSGRKLYEFLGIEVPYRRWIRTMIENYWFEKDKDYCIERNKNVGKVGYEIDHAITLDMAKVICGVEGNEISKIALHYFINYDDSMLDHIYNSKFEVEVIKDLCEKEIIELKSKITKLSKTK